MEKAKIIVDLFRKNWPLILILLTGTFLRLYKIDQYMTFLGDEGRDAIVVRNLLVNADPILIGPGTSIGNMYLGPLFYYFMAPFLLLWNFSPVGPAIGVAILGIVTIYLVYRVGVEWFSKSVGLIAAAFFAISPTVIIYSRSSWNPNIMPFFALLSIYSIWKVYSEKKFNWLIITAISFAFVMQSHYLGILLFPVLFGYWYLTLRNYKLNENWKLKIENFKKYSLFSLGILLLLMSPLLIFDIRHDYLNLKAFYKFITVREEMHAINSSFSISKIYSTFEQINSSLLTAKTFVGKFLTILMTAWLFVLLLKKKLFITSNNREFVLLLVWLSFGLIGLNFYRFEIYDHYFGFLFPVPFLLIGLLISKLLEINKYRIFGILLFGILVFINLLNNPISKDPNRQMQRSMMVANKIINESKGQKFNLAVIAETNREEGYQYFLEKENSKLSKIDPQIPSSVASQLFVICEIEKEKCNPINSPKFEIVGFGQSKIEGVWDVEGVIIYKLIHSK